MTPLLLLAALSSAQAYELWGYAWSPQAMPIYWFMADYNEDSLSNIPSILIDCDFDGEAECEYTSALSYQGDLLDHCFDNWQGAPCATFSSYFYEDYSPGNNGAAEDGYNLISWDDPHDYLATGVLGVTELNTDWQSLGWVSGKAIYAFTDVDITFNDDIDWASTEEIESGCGGGMQALEPVATHELGHFWGLGHSCEEGDPCTDPEDRDATMYWSTDNCSMDQASPNDNDLQGIMALYGPSASFDTLQMPVGKVPFQVDFYIESDSMEDVSDVAWNFGDSQRGSGTEVSHIYETAGQYSVSVDITGNTEGCGEWTYNFNQYGYVTACDLPVPAMSPEGEPYGGLFTYTDLGNLEIQLVNRTDTSVYGCLDTVVWQIYDGDQMIDELSGWSPKYAFEAAGTYRVVLNVGGPGGVVAEDLTIDVGAGGCSTVPVGAGLTGILAGLGLALRRRKRG